MRSILITGAAGFLGYHLSKKWLDSGYHVIGVDNMITGQEKNISDLKAHGKDQFYFIKADISKPWASWRDLIPTPILDQISYVFHFASIASPHLFLRYSLEIMEANSQGLQYAVNFADNLNAKVIFASTSEIYGSLTSETFREDQWGFTNTYGERACYDESKRIGEAYIYSTNKKNGTQHGLVRIFNTYGPRMNPADERVIQHLMKQALADQALTIHGDGQQVRSFCYVDDLIDGIYQYALKNITLPVNLGQFEGITIIDLAKTIKMVLNKEVPVVFTVGRSDDPKHRKPDLSRALNLLSPWRPKVFLQTGLIKMAEWVRNDL
ncbi:MAG: NAD-dependent epimerase/dehydratase family protein [Bdellovibrionaceae bacterium]|nr:NAD-dependent epimerase/dehydratase family protein [Pseudobdellovibrionaceae bacterium]